MIASTQTNHPLANATGVFTTADPETRLGAACQRLRQSGLRVTQPRIAIINVLIQHEAPVSIERIFGDLDRSSCDLVTVYRCLGAFEEIGLVKRNFSLNGTSLYHLADRTGPVYHVINRDTNGITALDAASTTEISALLERVENRLKSRGWTNVAHMLEFFARAAQPQARSPASRESLRKVSCEVPHEDVAGTSAMTGHRGRRARLTVPKASSLSV